MAKSGETVYLVSVGSYSDYKVMGIFSSREKAERYIDVCLKQNEDFYEDSIWYLEPAIETWEIDEAESCTILIKGGRIDEEVCNDL